MDCLSSENLKGGAFTDAIERKRIREESSFSTSTHLIRNLTLHFVDRSRD